MPSSQTRRILLTDKAVRSLPFAPAKPQIIRDSKVAGFYVWVGKSTKTYRFQYETPRVNGQRGSTMVQWLGEHPHATAEEARAKALEIVALRARGEAVQLLRSPSTRRHHQLPTSTRGSRTNVLTYGQVTASSQFRRQTDGSALKR